MNSDDGQRELSFVQLERAVVRLPAGAGDAVDGPAITLSIARGEFTSLLGLPPAMGLPLLRMVAGLEPPGSGRVAVGAGTPQPARLRTGLVFRRPVLLDWKTVAENVLLASELGRSQMEGDAAKAAQLLAVAGLADSRNSRPDRLTRAEAQKVSLCRALLTSPDLLLLDEPFDGLGQLEREQCSRDLQRLLVGSSSTVFMVTSGIEEAVTLSDSVAVTTRDGVAQTIRIDIPRPRLPDTETAARVAEHAARVRILLEAHGHLA